MARSADPVLAREVALRIVRELREAGHVAYFAGGCVRDELLSLRPTDFDVATDATPPRVRALFPRTAEVGQAFGVVLVHGAGLLPRDDRAVSEGRSTGSGVTVEVATFRADGPYTDARRPDSVSFSTPEEDARRRDFTINALFLDPLLEPGAPGRVIDFVGGQADLAARVVRAVGDADKRLAEDHLRALRAVRFAARLGFDIDPATREAITRHAAQLRGVSRERIGDELRRMLVHPSRAAAAGLIESLALDQPVLNEGPNPVRAHGSAGGHALLAALARRPADADLLTFSTYLAAWALGRESAAASGLSAEAIRDLTRKWRGALCLSNDESAEFSDVLEVHSTLFRSWSGMPVAARKRLVARKAFAPAMALVAAADPPGHSRILSEVNDLQLDGIGIDPVPLITGEDLIAEGLPQGPLFKRVLDAVRDAQLEGKVGTKSAAMELARTLRV